MSHHDLLSYVKARWGKDQRKCDKCQRNDATLTCASCKDVQFCGAQACGADHRCLIGNPVKRGREGGEEGGEKIYDLNDIPPDVWGIVMKYLNVEDMKSLSVVDKQRLRGMRTRGVAQRFLWRISLEAYRNIRDKPWMKNIQRIVVNSLITLEALKDIGLTLTQVRLEDPIAEPLYPGLFPDTIKKVVILYRSFNQPLAGLFPPSLKILRIENLLFNSSIDGLPVGLQHLTIENANFNQPINNLPPRLLGISILSCFNRPIDNFPRSLRNIKLGDNFNQHVPYFPNLRKLSIYNPEINGNSFTFSKRIKSIRLAGKLLTFK